MSSSLQKLRPWILALGKGKEQGEWRDMGPQPKIPGTGVGRVQEGQGGKEKKPKLNYLLDFLCTPELEGEKRESE